MGGKNVLIYTSSSSSFRIQYMRLALLLSYTSLFRKCFVFFLSTVIFA